MEETRAYDTWRALAEKALKGAPLASLDTPVEDTGDMAPLRPLAFPADPLYAGRATPGPWEVVQRVDTDENAATQACEDLENGATALAVVLAGAPAAHGRGLTLANVADLDRALEGVHLDLCTLHMEAGARASDMLALLKTLAEQRGTAPAAVHLGADPFGTFAATGDGAPAAETRDALQNAAAAFASTGWAGTALAVDGRVAAEAGASPVLELAFILAALHSTVVFLEEAGAMPAAILPAIALRLSASHDQFATIAKLRAARRLYRLYAEAHGV
ncbi:MAG: methylmalonyl-CoA mutase family protein, partial [Pseudomonadota bacterium]